MEHWNCRTCGTQCTARTKGLQLAWQYLGELEALCPQESLLLMSVPAGVRLVKNDSNSRAYRYSDSEVVERCSQSHPHANSKSKPSAGWQASLRPVFSRWLIHSVSFQLNCRSHRRLAAQQPGSDQQQDKRTSCDDSDVEQMAAE